MIFDIRISPVWISSSEKYNLILGANFYSGCYWNSTVVDNGLKLPHIFPPEVESISLLLESILALWLPLMWRIEQRHLCAGLNLWLLLWLRDCFPHCTSHPGGSGINKFHLQRARHASRGKETESIESFEIKLIFKINFIPLRIVFLKVVECGFDTDFCIVPLKSVLLDFAPASCF